MIDEYTECWQWIDSLMRWGLKVFACLAALAIPLALALLYLHGLAPFQR